MKPQVVSQNLFKNAKWLHEKEDFSGSTKILKSILHDSEESNCPDVNSLSEIMALIGWNMVALRDFSDLLIWEEKLLNMGISDQPVFNLIRIWQLGIKGKISDALLMTNQFLESQDTQIHKLTPDFLMLRSHFSSRAGNVEQPIQDGEIAHSIFLAQKREFEAGRAALILGVHFHSLSNYQKAKEWYSRADSIFDSLSLQKKKSVLALSIGIIHYKLGNFHQAIQLLNKSLKIGTNGNWLHRQCYANIALGTVYRMTRSFDLAKRHLQDGLSQAQALSMAREEALAQEFMGDIFRDEGNFTAAQKCYATTLAIITPLAPEGDVVSETHRRIGECHTLNGDFISAKPHLMQALAMTRTQGGRFEEAATLRVLAERSLAMGKSKIALMHIIPACDILDDIGANYELAIARFRYAEILVAEKDTSTSNVPSIVLLNQAWLHASESQARFHKTGVKWWLTQARGLVKRITTLHDQQERADRVIASAKINNDGEGYNPGNIIVHKSHGMRMLLAECDLYAPSNNAILIRGATGTGKELIARRLHDKSGRSGNLVSVNVASISANLFEREFFGHVKGAFSGAENDSRGFAELAHKGTLFLDEIGDLPLELQPKLLRLLQDGVFHTVGDPKERRADIRFIAATNVDLFEAMIKGTFREDLYYRLETLAIDIPALKDRPDDILPLMEHFLSIAACAKVRISDYLNPTSVDLLGDYSWPGNVREIISVCQKLHLQVTTSGTCKTALGRAGKTEGMLCGPGYLKMEAAEGPLIENSPISHQRIVSALESTGGNKQKAAEMLQMSRSTLYRQMKRLEI